MRYHGGANYGMLYTSPEEHAANPPETWTVVKGTQNYSTRTAWHLTDQNGKALDSYPTKRDATSETQPGGWHHDRYRQETAWYAGVTPASWKSWVAVQAERAEKARAEADRVAREERMISRMGTSPKELAKWSKAVEGKDVDKLRAAAEKMLALLTDGNLLNPDLLNRDEAAEVTTELSDSWGFGTAVFDWLHQIKYLGLHADKTAVEILEIMEREEDEARRLHLPTVY